MFWHSGAINSDSILPLPCKSSQWDPNGVLLWQQISPIIFNATLEPHCFAGTMTMWWCEKCIASNHPYKIGHFFTRWIEVDLIAAWNIADLQWKDAIYASPFNVKCMSISSAHRQRWSIILLPPVLFNGTLNHKWESWGSWYDWIEWISPLLFFIILLVCFFPVLVRKLVSRDNKDGNENEHCVFKR